MFSQAHFSLPAASRRAACAMAGTTALVLLALSHHPVAGRAASLQESLIKIVELQFMDGVVHGVLIVMLAVLAAGFATFSVVIGHRRPPVLLAMAAYAVGCCIMVAGMLLDGFAVPQLAAKFVAAPPAQIEIVYVVLRVIGTVIQVLTKAGLVAMGVAFLFWSYALAARPHWLARGCAAIGALSSLASVAFLLFGSVTLTPASLMAIFGVHALWNFAVAGLLWQSSQADYLSICRPAG